jgi:hypothetical protein
MKTKNSTAGMSASTEATIIWSQSTENLVTKVTRPTSPCGGRGRAAETRGAGPASAGGERRRNDPRGRVRGSRQVAAALRRGGTGAGLRRLGDAAPVPSPELWLLVHADLRRPARSWRSSGGLRAWLSGSRRCGIVLGLGRLCEDTDSEFGRSEVVE